MCDGICAWLYVYVCPIAKEICPGNENEKEITESSTGRGVGDVPCWCPLQTPGSAFYQHCQATSAIPQKKKNQCIGVLELLVRCFQKTETPFANNAASS